MVAKFLDDNKPKTALKSTFTPFQSSSILIDFTDLICQILTKFGVESERTVSKFRKRTFCVVFTYSIKRADEIRTFHVTVIQRRQAKKCTKKRDARAKLLLC